MFSGGEGGGGVDPSMIASLVGGKNGTKISKDKLKKIEGEFI